jgi:hypothetical protein
LPDGEGTPSACRCFTRPSKPRHLAEEPGEHLGDDGGLIRLQTDPRRIARLVGIEAIAIGRSRPRQHWPGAEFMLPTAACSLGDERTLVFGDGTADVQK